MPCFVRDEATSLFGSLLVVTPDPNLMEPVWASHIKQCVEQSAEGVPLLCAGANKASGVCQEETGCSPPPHARLTRAFPPWMQPSGKS